MTKIAHFVPTTEKALAEGVARLFWDNIWKLYSLPKSIITDRGVQFAVGIIRELNRMLGIYKKAKLQARIKPTALCSVIDKENSIEFPLDLLCYIYNYYCGYAPCLP